MLRADDLNSQFANGANVINALTNVNEAHSADLARKKQAAMDRLRFDTEIGDVERQRQMELLKKYDDDSIFGGIKELMGKYKTPNPEVANAGAEYFGAQVDALTGQSPVNKEEALMSKLVGLGGGTIQDKQRTAQLSRDIRSGYITPRNETNIETVADQKTIDKYGDMYGISRKSPSRKTLVADVKAKAAKGKALSDNFSRLNTAEDNNTVGERNEPVGIVRGDVKSYLRKARNDGNFVSEFKGSYSEMDSQNLNMYKPLVDEAVANGDWKAADMLNRQYMANKRSIDKSWGEKEGRGGVDSLFSGPPRDRTAGEKTKEYSIQFQVPIRDADGNPTGQWKTEEAKISLTDWERRNLTSKKTLGTMKNQKVSDEWLSGHFKVMGDEGDVAVTREAESRSRKGYLQTIAKEYEDAIANRKVDSNGNAIVYIDGQLKRISKDDYENAQASLIPSGE